MKYTIDTDNKTLTVLKDSKSEVYSLYSKEAFNLISEKWIKLGWNQKYSYTFTWLGRPFIQLPEDVLRMQEVIFQVKPDVIVETGVAHGGSLIFSASLCKALEKGRVLGIDIEIRKNNREAIESHFLAPYITLLEGSSVDSSIIQKVKEFIRPGEKVLVILDSNHSYSHVAKELELYHKFVTPGSYIVATDGIMKDLHDVPKGAESWKWDNPANAAVEFAKNHPEFELKNPKWLFNESGLSENITYWPSAWLLRKE